MNCTNWEKIISDEKELKSIKTQRAKKFIKKTDWSYENIVEENEKDGWILVKPGKNNKGKYQKEKPYDEQFEDLVWVILYKMGFTEMNSDRNFKISYKDDLCTQQIDVFAADEETVILVECKVANEEGQYKDFKKDIEAFHGEADGLRKEIKNRYPGRKIKQIFATKNYLVSDANKEYLKQFGIAYFSENEIDYYQELVNHLGSAAKYQLLGNLFANQEIMNMDGRIPAIQGKMGGHTYYSFSIEPEKLLKIGYVLHRSEINSDMLPTYQRIIKKSRLKSVQNFIENKGYFPNSIIISIDTKNKKPLQFDRAKNQVDGAVANLGILHLPKMYRSAYIIDGQHRLYGYSGSMYASKEAIPVVAFENLDKKEQVRLFMDINENQKAVSKNLRNTLNADIQWESDIKRERREALKLRMAQKFGESSISPLYGRVLIGEDKQTITRCITMESIRLALNAGEMISKYNKKDEIEVTGVLDFDNEEKTLNYLFSYYCKCFNYLKGFLSDQWKLGSESYITINNTIGGLLRTFDSIVMHLADEKNLTRPLQISCDQLFADSKYYLDSLITFFEDISEENINIIKKARGGAAPKDCCRLFEKAIHDERPKFQPKGFVEYWEEHSKEYNADTIVKIAKIDKSIKLFIKTALVEKYGNDYKKEIPKETFRSTNQKVSDAEYEGETLDFWDALTLKNCRDIIINGSNWTDLFKEKFSLPSQPKGGKVEKTEWLVSIEKLQSSSGKSTFTVSKSTYEMVCEVFEIFCH